MTYLKNYTTTIASQKTIYEIENILSKNGAAGIAKEYDDNANVIAVVFSLKTNDGIIGFKLPCEFEKVSIVLRKLRSSGKIQGITYAQAKNYTHAINVGWRIIKDWIEAQLSLIKIDLASIEQVFLPYAYNPLKKQTLYETLKENNFNLLLSEKHD